MNTETNKLLATARKAAHNTYSPYSKFPVGAALMTVGGKVFTGCNVENASYGLTICAERVAVASAVAAGHRKFKALAVVGGRGKAARPCGACLQVLSEFCGPDFPVTLASLDKPSKVERLTLGDLLPHTFKL
jgi:cytidine deaminase